MLSEDGRAPAKLRDRAEAHRLILGHAQRAGIGHDTPEMKHFARELFLLARQCGAAGLLPEARMLSVSVWDKSMVGAVDRAIRESNLGFNPIVDGTTLRIPLPELNEQRRKELVKIAHNYAENARVAARHVRRDGMDHLKKAEKDGIISEDDHRAQSDRVQKMTDETIAMIDSSLGEKEAEIMHV